ncbi:DinB family protein [Polaribacter sargassicola]|uniref:DinB family protein n=1 Tax=Polaribacter sargassicola TaxID=2836891 RepID=UPI001F483CDE|nr:DinB family protein [Polaribacter sp. DS7-9]MCG1036288.1 DinB family protein [Polaribacter sp. DS7-9]
MISAIENNLQRGVNLLKVISDEQYSNSSVGPYHSTIGGHMRHVLDVFSCIFKGVDNNFVDFSVRERNELAEKQTSKGIEYFEEIILKLKDLNIEDFDKEISVCDDMGLGKETAKYTLAATLMQAHSHAIHHFASIGYLVYQLEIELPDADFGYNPTSPKKGK